MNDTFSISGNVVDIINRKITPSTVHVKDGKIEKIVPDEKAEYGTYLMPGFIDAHIHIESSMLIPSEFARIAVIHGTVATVSDPHEIANVLGIDGIRYMINNGMQVPFKFYFGASSCVPATSFETAGAVISANEIKELFEVDGLVYLSEMMNYPGVLFADPGVMEKIKTAKDLRKPVDGHSPGLKGEQAKKYIDAGISTDHECYMLDEALDKLKYGMKIIIREGSAAKNYDALHTIIPEHYENVMFCSDDRHPDDLILGEIDKIVRRSVAHGYDVFKVLQCACINPIKHYGLNVGMLREGDPADFIEVNNLKDFKVMKTFINGEKVAENGKSNIQKVTSEIINHFNAEHKTADDFKVKQTGKNIRVIKAINGEIITQSFETEPKVENGFLVSDVERDILKITVVERYTGGKPSIAFINNFGLKKGAIASSVAHDSHNIIAVGATDGDIALAINSIIDARGGICVVSDGKVNILGLPIAGLMTNEDAYIVAEKYQIIDKFAKKLGSKLSAPFMTLSFMALLVIPSLKLSDKGLFDGTKFEFAPLQF
jgi:adenine deaminase